jgi:hypothetical protein
VFEKDAIGGLVDFLATGPRAADKFLLKIRFGHLQASHALL